MFSIVSKGLLFFLFWKEYVGVDGKRSQLVNKYLKVNFISISVFNVSEEVHWKIIFSSR